MGFTLWWLLLLQSAGLRVCRLQWLQHMGSVVVSHGLSCPAASGIFPDQGSNLCSLPQQVNSQPLDHQGSSGLSFIFKKTLVPLAPDLCGPLVWL